MPYNSHGVPIPFPVAEAIRHNAATHPRASENTTIASAKGLAEYLTRLGVDNLIPAATEPITVNVPTSGGWQPVAVEDLEGTIPADARLCWGIRLQSGDTVNAAAIEQRLKTYGVVYGTLMIFAEWGAPITLGNVPGLKGASEESMKSLYALAMGAK